jgi:hypothetical protein
MYMLSTLVRKFYTESYVNLSHVYMKAFLVGWEGVNTEQGFQISIFVSFYVQQIFGSKSIVWISIRRIVISRVISPSISLPLSLPLSLFLYLSSSFSPSLSSSLSSSLSFSLSLSLCLPPSFFLPLSLSIPLLLCAPPPISPSISLPHDLFLSPFTLNTEDESTPILTQNRH